MLIRYSSYISHLYNIRRFLYWGVNKYAVRCVYPDLPQDKQTEEDYWYSYLLLLNYHLSISFPDLRLIRSFL